MWPHVESPDLQLGTWENLLFCIIYFTNDDIINIIMLWTMLWKRRWTLCADALKCFCKSHWNEKTSVNEEFMIF